jgi:hypothetical protein
MRSENVTVSLILGPNEIEKIDEMAGKGNRSAYIRCLIQHATGGIELKLMDLEAETRHLYSLLKEERRLTRRLKGRLAKKGVKIVEEIDKELVSASMEYHTWRESMLVQLGTISQDLKLSWVSGRAKQYGISTSEMLKILEPLHKGVKTQKQVKLDGKIDPLKLYNQIKDGERKKKAAEGK